MKPPALLLLLICGALAAQEPNPTQRQIPTPTGGPAPIFRVTVVSRVVKAINYHHRTGSTRIGFRGTELMPEARGDAEVESQTGSTKIETSLDHMSPPSQFGPEYLTYVLWGVTPEGRAVNLGEVVLDGDHAKLLSTTDLQTFGLIVTAEPYFSVTQPSDVVVAENFVRKDTAGTIEQIDAKYELLQRGQYVLDRNAYKPVRVDPKGPLQVAEAENAVEIAKLAGADQYAADTMHKATVDLQNARDFMNGSKNRKAAETNAREAAQMAEDARLISLRKQREEALAAERAEAARRQEEAIRRQEEAQAEARRQAEMRSQAQSEREAAEQAKQEADRARQEAEAAAANAAREREAAEKARAEALAQQQAALSEAQSAKSAAAQAEAERNQLRERLRSQLNAILETRETQRGLIVNINDVLFDFNKYTLKPGAREKLAKVAGILLAYPGLEIQLEGHTDNVGSEEYNLKLSQERADAVRSYLVSQGVPQKAVDATGLGESDPVADNKTAAGRQMNRRVDMVVSGDPIGLGTAARQAPETQSTPPQQTRPAPQDLDRNAPPNPPR